MHLLFFHIGRYMQLMRKVFSKPEKLKVYYNLTMQEIEVLGLNSIGLVVLVAIFSGAILAVQLAYNMENPLVPKTLIGLGTRDALLLEFSSTILCIILAGKIGSHISSEIGSMRVSEQIEALEMMGINSAGYLIMPKIVAIVIILPMLSILCSCIGMLGGFLSVPLTGTVRIADYLNGLTYLFNPHYVVFSLEKTVFYALLIGTIPSYYGYYVEGGALEVGKAGTKAVVATIVMILFSDLILTQLLMK